MNEDERCNWNNKSMSQQYERVKDEEIKRLEVAKKMQDEELGIFVHECDRKD